MNRMISNTLYSLKRKHPVRVTIHRRTGEDLDLQTGVKSPTFQTYTVERAVRLPDSRTRVYLPLGEQGFTYGGLTDTRTVQLILDAKELPVGWTPSRDDYTVINGVRYEVTDIDDFQQEGWILKIKSLVGQPVEAIYAEHVRSTIHLVQEVELDD